MKHLRIAICLTVICQCVCFSTSRARERQQGEPLQITPDITRVIIDSLGQALYRNYVFPDTALKMSAYLKNEFKKGTYTGIKDPRELADRLWQDLEKAHHDGHLRLMYAPGMAKDLADTSGRAEQRRTNDSLMLIDMRKRNFLFTKAEILPGNIGYVKFNGFVGFEKEARPTITGAFRFVANTKALIIDLRDNGGGSVEMVAQVESYFFPTKTHMNDVINRDKSKWELWTNPAEADSVLLQMPVYILTARRTFSGAEDFSYGMQSIHRAVIVGDTTGGGAHPTGPVPVTLGFVAAVPWARSMSPYTHTDWEGTGVIPDIPAPSDKALEAAEKAIITDQLKNGLSDMEKNAAQWQLDDLSAKQSQEVLDSASLAAYAGKYQGGLVFYANRSGLYCKNAERGDQVFKLIPITSDKFVLDENVHVEFKKDDKGSFSEIIMWWSDGRVSNKVIVSRNEEQHVPN
jgi:retinol-binding protein 3